MEAEIGGLPVQVKEPQDSPATSGSWQRGTGLLLRVPSGQTLLAP